MRLSTRAEYGIAAMIDLAEQSGHGPVGGHEIAARQDIPEPYLNQTMTLLRKAGLINSRRGPGGGHILARPPTEITLAEIISALEGPLWTSEGAQSRTGRSLLDLSDLWGEIDSAIYGILTRVTVAELVERSHRRGYSYQI